MLKDNQEQWVEENMQFRQLVNKLYKNLFTMTNNLGLWYQKKVTFPRLEDEEIQKLDAQVPDEKVQHAIFSMNSWKARSLDGYPTMFYQESWSIVGKNVCEFMRKICTTPSTIAMVNQH